ncbi:MAG: carbon-nitrogen hydrolase family protein [Desulfurococcaceae archaeon]
MPPLCGGLVELMKREGGVVKVAVVNFEPVIDGLKPNKRATLDKIKEFTVKAAQQGANIVVFPELALTSYSGFPPSMACELSEPVPGPSTSELQEVASQCSAYIAFGMIERAESKLYNSAVLVGPSGVLGVYRKVHLFKPVESWAEPGSSYPAVHTPWGLVGLGICRDNYCYPEVARIYGVMGARIHLNLTAFPRFPDVEDYVDFYMTMLGARSLENTMFIASANMVGVQGELSYFGHSMVVGPKPGKMNYEIYAGPLGEEEGVAVASIDLSWLRNVCMGLKDIFEDRRPDTYSLLVKREGYS